MDVVELGIRVTSEGVDKANKSLRDMPHAAGLAEKSVESLTDSIKGLAAAYVSFEGLKSAVGIMVDFDSKVKATANLTGTSFETIKSLAMESAIATSKYAGDVASAFGVIGSKAPALLENVAALQAVTNESLELAEAATATGDAMNDMEAAGAITSLLNSYSVSAADASAQSDRFGDALAAAAQVGSVSISNLTQTIAGVGTSFALAGVGAEELLGVAELLGEKSDKLQGAEAATALNSIVIKLQTAKDEFEKFGVTGVDVALSQDGLAGALRRAQPMLNDNAALVKVFGTEHANAVKIMLSNIDGIEEYTRKITGTDTATTQAAAGMESLSRQTAALGSNIKNIIAGIGGDFFSAPALKSLKAVNGYLVELQTNSRSAEIAVTGLTTAFAAFAVSGIAPVIASMAIATAKTLEHQAAVAISAAGYRGVEAAAAQSAVVQAQSNAKVTASALAEAQAHMRDVEAVNLWGEARANAIRTVDAAQADHVASLNAVSVAEARAAEAMSATTVAARAKSAAMASATAVTGAATAATDGLGAMLGGPLGIAILGGIVAWQAYESELVEVKSAGLVMVGALLNAYENLRYSAEMAITSIAGFTSGTLGDAVYLAAEFMSIIPDASPEVSKSLNEMSARLKGNAVSLEDVTAAHLARKDAIQDELNAVIESKGYEDGLQQQTAKLTGTKQELADVAKVAAGATSGLSEAQKKAAKDAKELKEKQEDFTKSLKEQIATFSMSSAESRRWKAEQDGLLNAEGDAKLKKLEALEQEEEQRKNLWEQDKQASEDFIRNQEKNAEAVKYLNKQIEDGEWKLKSMRREASKGFEGAFTSALQGGGLKSIGDFLMSDKGGDFRFADLLGGGSSFGDLGFGEFGGQMDSFIRDTLGGIENAGSYLNSAALMLSGSSKGFMEGAGSAIGTYFGGPAGAAIGQMLGGALSNMGIGGAGPYSGKGFQITGSLADYSLASMASNNKGTSTDVYNKQAGTFGKWQVADVLAGNESLGQQQLQSLMGVDKMLTGYRDNLFTTIGEVFGEDVSDKLSADFNPTINISGENVENQLGQWISKTTTDAIANAAALSYGEDNPLSALVKTLIADAANPEEALATAGKFSILEQTFNATGLGAENLNARLIEASGGLDKTTAQAAQYYNLFFTEDERARNSLAKTSAHVTQVFEEMGKPVPQTAEEFRNLVDETVNMGEAGAETYNDLMDVSGSLYAVQNAANAAQNALDALDMIAIAPDERDTKAWNDLNDDLKDLGLDALPASRDGLSDYLDQFDKNNEAQREQIAFLEKNKSAIDSHYTALEKSASDAAKEAERQASQQAKAYEQAGDAHQKYIDDLMKGAESLNDWIMQQLTGNDSAATFSQQFQLAQAEFNRVASMGSQASAQDLQRSAETLLQLNRQGFGARGAGLEAQVLSQVQGIAAGMGGGSNEAVVALLQQLLDATQAGNADNSRQLRRMNDTRRRA